MPARSKCSRIFNSSSNTKPGRIRRRLEHREAAVLDADRLLLLGLEGFEISGRNQGSRPFETGRQPPRQAAAIERFRAVRGDLFERSGEFGLHDRSTEWRRLTVGEKSRGAARVRHQSRPVFIGEMAVGAGGAKAVAGKGDRLGEQVAPRQAAVGSMHLAERRHGAGDRYRQRTSARDAAGVTFWRGGGRGGAGAVEHDGAAGRLVVYMIEPVATEPRHHRLDNRERHRRRDRSVHRVAARPQRQEAGLGGERMIGRDGPVSSDDHRPVGTHFCRHYHSPFATMVSNKANDTL